MSFAQTLTQTLSRSGLKLQKAGPTIAVVGGVVGLGATVVMASRATLKSQQILEDHRKGIEDMNEAYKIAYNETNDEGELIFSEKDYAEEHAARWLNTGLAMLKIYGPSIVVGGLSIAAILGGHRTMGNRIASLTAAYSVLESTFTKYRENVQEELGLDNEKELYAGNLIKALDKEKEDLASEIESEVKSKYKNRSVHARYFDEQSRRWTRNPQENKAFLSHAQNLFNDILASRGHVFLNEVYDHLGFDTTPEGQVVGWVFTGDEGSNNYVDFGVFDSTDEASRMFINGNEHSVLLDFNTDGIIWNQI